MFTAFCTAGFIACAGCTSTGADFGNWYSCQADGFYLEMITQGGQYQNISRNMVSEWVDFRVAGDTLIHASNPSLPGKPSTHKALIRYPSPDAMALDYLTSDEHWEFKRIPNFTPQQTDAAKLADARARARAAECIEIEKPDSSDKFIYFQF